MADIRQKAIGWKRLGAHLILFLDRGSQVLTRLDSSVEYGHNSTGAWEFNLDALAQLCSAGGIAFESETFETAQQFLAERPEWAPRNSNSKLTMFSRKTLENGGERSRSHCPLPSHF